MENPLEKIRGYFRNNFKQYVNILYRIKWVVFYKDQYCLLQIIKKNIILEDILDRTTERYYDW